jgi:hypothetical protein
MRRQLVIGALRRLKAEVAEIEAAIGSAVSSRLSNACLSQKQLPEQLE